MLAPSDGGLILYQAYGNLYAMTDYTTTIRYTALGVVKLLVRSHYDPHITSVFGEANKLLAMVCQPIREDELLRIKDQEGKVISWNVARVLGVLDMSRATCDRYLRPWIILMPNITFTTRTSEDAWLIIASDGLSDVMTNNKVDEVARMFNEVYCKVSQNKKYSLIKIKEHIKKRPPLAASEKQFVIPRQEYKDNVYEKMVGSPKGYEVSVTDLDKPLSLLSEKKTKLEQEDVDRICKIFLISYSVFRKRIKDINEYLRSKLIDEEPEIVDAKDSNEVIPPGDELKTILKIPAVGTSMLHHCKSCSPSCENMEGKSTGYIFLESSLDEVINLSDSCQTGAKEVLKELKTMVIKTAMATEDYQATANQEKR
nr:probable protein phosphatase 2C 6 [Tanacetum cinerariifolium]